MKKIWIIILLISIFNLSNAQEFEGGTNKTSTKDTKDSIKPKINAWILIGAHYERKEALVDSTLDNFQIYKSSYLECFSTQFLGNIGQANYPIIYFNEEQRINSSYLFSPPIIKKTNSDLIFSQAYKAYMLTPENLKFYNTNKPYTNLVYTSGTKGRREQSIRFVHTRNFNKYLNFGILFSGNTAQGEYSKQTTTSKIFSFFSNYNHQRYNMHAAFINNKLTADQNGGLISDTLRERDFFPTQLTGANTTNFKRVFFINQSYTIGKKISIPLDSLRKDSVFRKIKSDSTVINFFTPRIIISHTSRIDRNFYKYIDNAPSESFYGNYFIDSTATFDSIFFQNITNNLNIRLLDDWNNYFRVGALIGITNELYKYYNLIDFVKLKNETNFSSNNFQLGLFNHKGKFINWTTSVKYYITGHFKNNYEIEGNILKVIRLIHDSLIINLNSSFYKKRNDLFEERYYSNHYQWENSFNEKETFNLKLKVNCPKWKMLVGTYATDIKNFIYFDYLGIPKQNTERLKIWSVFINKDFELGNLRIKNKLVYQKVSDGEILPLPQITVYSTIYFQAFLFKVLTLQIGSDIMFTSKYRGLFFAPSTGQFYIQNYNSKIEVGGEPIFDPYLNLKLKSALIFLKFEHINSLFSPNLYYSAPYYPMEGSAFKFGVSWRFFN